MTFSVRESEQIVKQVIKGLARAHLSKKIATGAFKPKQEVRAAFQEKYRYDPAGFARDCIDWAAIPRQNAIQDMAPGLAPYQEEVLDLLGKESRVAVRACRGVGKSTIAAIAVVWFAEVNDGARDWKIVTSASAWSQLTNFLWPEIHKIIRYLKWNLLGRDPYRPQRELLQIGLKLKTGSAFAVNAANAEQEEGAHASAIMYVFDEAKLIPDQKWDSAEGALTGGDVKFLAISTPSYQAGRFYHIFQKRPGTEQWCTRHVLLEEAVAAGRVSADWVQKRKDEWGETSSLFRMQVLGEFGSYESMGMIPLSWVERANANWLVWRDEGFPGEITQVGIDVGGGSGSDMSVIVVVYDRIKVRRLRCTSWAIDKENATMELVGKLGRYGSIGVALHVDAVGIGAGAYHRLHELGYAVYPFVSSAGTALTDATRVMGFLNWRAAGWHILRDMLNPDNALNICIPPDDISQNDIEEEDRAGIVLPNSSLTADLTVIKRIMTSAGNWKVQAKDEIRKDLGASPDQGDAVMMALSGPILWAEEMMGQTPPRIVYDPVTLE